MYGYWTGVLIRSSNPSLADCYNSTKYDMT